MCHSALDAESMRWIPAFPPMPGLRRTGSRMTESMDCPIKLDNDRRGRWIPAFAGMTVRIMSVSGDGGQGSAYGGLQKVQNWD